MAVSLYVQLISAGACRQSGDRQAPFRTSVGRSLIVPRPLGCDFRRAIMLLVGPDNDPTARPSAAASVWFGAQVLGASFLFSAETRGRGVGACLLVINDILFGGSRFQRASLSCPSVKLLRIYFFVSAPGGSPCFQGFLRLLGVGCALLLRRRSMLSEFSFQRL